MIHILVVDDDEKLTQSICSYLNNCGYEAKGMLSAESAYDEMYSSLYDLIISDIMMPGTDGFAFAETIRRLNKRIPILFVPETICPLNRGGSIWGSTIIWSNLWT